MNQRTSQQNRALRKYEKELSDAMIEAGVDMKTFVKEGIEIPATPSVVHEVITLPVVKALFNKTSTTQLERHEVDRVYEMIQKAVGERLGLSIPFPSRETLSAEEQWNIL